MNYSPQSEQTRILRAEEQQQLFEKSEILGRALVNSLVIEGFLLERDQERFTAAGLPVVRVKLRHVSQELGLVKRQVICDISVLCIGKELCEQLSHWENGCLLGVEGFLARNSYKDELSWIIIEATKLALLDSK